MKTYVKLSTNSVKFSNIFNAVEYMENHGIDSAELSICSENATVLESQEIAKNSFGNIEYNEWAIIGYRFFEDGRIESSDLLAEEIDSEAEAREIADTMRDKFESYDSVKIEFYNQTLTENIGDVTKSYKIFQRKED